MNRRIDRQSALETCLEKLHRGASIDEALQDCPRWWHSHIRPLLEAASQAQKPTHTQPVPAAAQVRSRQMFLEQAYRLQQQPRQLAAWAYFRPVVVFLSVLVFVFLGVLGTGAVSADALPGQPLYSYKLWTEKTRLMLVSRPAERIKLEGEFDQNRVAEVEALFAHEDHEEVTFAGFLSQDGSDIWRVAGIPLEIPEGVPFGEEFKVGVYVEVHGVLVENGKVHVESIQLRQITFIGKLEKINGELWQIGGVTLRVMPTTEIKMMPKTGDRVLVEALRQRDGGLVAIRLEVIKTSQPATLEPGYPAPTEVEYVPTATRKPTRIPDQATATQEPTDTPDSDGNQPEIPVTSPTATPTKHEEDRDPTKTPKPTKTPTPTPTPTDND